MHWEHHNEDFLSTSSTFLIILNEFSAYFKHNSAESTIGIFVNLLMLEIKSYAHSTEIFSMSATSEETW